MAGLTNVILVAHILVSIILVIVVLMQRSEGGGLGIGGGGGGGGGAGGMMTGRGVAGALVRTTIIFGAIFFISSLTLTVIATQNAVDRDATAPTDIEIEGATDEPEDLGVDLDILNTEGTVVDDPLAADPAQPGTPADPEEQPSETNPQ